MDPLEVTLEVTSHYLLDLVDELTIRIEELEGELERRLCNAMC
jgi:hypothetical protein